MTFRTDMQDLVTELLAEFGTTGQLEFPTTGTYDASTRRATDPGPTTLDVVCSDIIDAVRKVEVDGSKVTSGKVKVKAEGLTLTPRPNCVLVHGPLATRLTVGEVTTRSVNGLPLVYELAVRSGT